MYTIKDILQIEVAPALGCTEPAAGAFCTAAGVICDGAKTGCAFKLATAAGTAVQSALFSLHGIDVKPSDGIIGHTTEQTTRNLGQISTKGMIETDRTILEIMMQKQFAD